MGSLTKAAQSLGLKKDARNNILQYANKKLNVYLKRNGKWMPTNQSFIEKVALFRELTGETPFFLSKKEAYTWILSIWLKGDNAVIKKCDPFNFYFTPEWISLRKIVLRKYGRICMKCGSMSRISVDHIKPRSLYPELELNLENLQVLCTLCNSTKSNKFIIDYRTTQ